MQGLECKNFFFFYNDCSSVIIKPESLEHGYLALLNEDLETAGNIFTRLDSPRAKWAVILVSILNGYMKTSPTYFQIRNFLEIDMDLLLKNEKLSYLELLLGSLDILSSINQEVYKYAGRVMFVNKLYSASIRYLEKSKKIYYNDAELHFLLAKYFMHVNDCEQALFYINECLNLIPEYYPAKIIKQEIEERWF